jgi:hypothetical protein
MLSAFFENKGLTFTYIMPKGTKVNVNHAMKALGNFVKPVTKKRPEITKSTKHTFFPSIITVHIWTGGGRGGGR